MAMPFTGFLETLMLALQVLPLLTVIGLLASGRAGPVSACLAALVLTLPAAFAVAGAGLPGFVLAQTLAGAWLALPAMAIVLGGLLFHAAVERPSAAPAGGSPARQAFTAAFLLGPFTEVVTGFGVGSIFAIRAVQRAGATGAPAAAIGLLALSLIPWGGLGPGSALGAALAGVAPQAMLARNAVQSAAFLLCLLPLFWRWCALAGIAVTPRERAGQAGWTLGVGALLVAWTHLLPWEVAGLLATGPLLAARLWLDRQGQVRAGLLAALPYGLLVACLLLSRSWPSPPAWHGLDGLPPLPVNHVAAVLWLVALGLLAVRRIDPKPALRRGVRPAVAILLFVVLSRWLAAAGVPEAVAGMLGGLLGRAARFGAPLLALVSGFVAGSNVGSNAMLMPLQAALGRAGGVPDGVLPAVQNFVGAQASMFSPQVASVFGALAGVAPGPIWRLAWPVFAILLLIGLASVAAWG